MRTIKDWVSSTPGRGGKEIFFFLKHGKIFFRGQEVAGEKMEGACCWGFLG